MKRLNRQHAENANISSLESIRIYLRNLLYEEARPDNKEWLGQIAEVIDFQDTDGSFKLLNTYEVESDIRVDFCHVPTYLCTAILIKAYMADSGILGEDGEKVLHKALDACCYRELRGHGYGAKEEQIAALQMFRKAGIVAFLTEYAGISERFSEMMERISAAYAFESDEQIDAGLQGDLQSIHRALQPKVFVYGTLLRGQSNYNHFLAPATPLCEGYVEGYEMFDLGAFPGIKEGNGEILGEVYEVTREQLRAIDRLEGEGQLYLRKCTHVKPFDGKATWAYIYVYNGDASHLEALPAGQQPFAREHVWYVAYGSNMKRERFSRYIEGGPCPYNGREYPACTDTIMPVTAMPYFLRYNMYYGNYDQGAWSKSAVSFLDTSVPGFAFGRAYLISREQAAHVHQLEGAGPSWYPDTVDLGEIHGIRVITFTNHERRDTSSWEYVSEDYRAVLREGMKETYPNKEDAFIESYLESRPVF